MEYSSEKYGVSYRVTHFVRMNKYFSFQKLSNNEILYSEKKFEIPEWNILMEGFIILLLYKINIIYVS